MGKIRGFEEFEGLAGSGEVMQFLPFLERVNPDPSLAIREGIIQNAWSQAMGANMANLGRVGEGHVFHGHTQRDIRVATSFVMWFTDNEQAHTGLQADALSSQTAVRNMQVAKEVLEQVLPAEAYPNLQDVNAIATTLTWLGTHDGRKFIEGYKHKLDVVAYRMKHGAQLRNRI